MPQFDYCAANRAIVAILFRLLLVRWIAGDFNGMYLNNPSKILAECHADFEFGLY